MPLTNEQIDIPKKTQEELLDERYGKGYSFGKKMQSGIPMPEPDEIPYTADDIIKKHPELYWDINGSLQRGKII